MNTPNLSHKLALTRSWRGDGPAPGFSVTLEVAFRCNVRCVFCSRWSDPTDLGLDAIEGVAEDMAALDAGYVSLTGGDPFVRSDIREIIDAFARRGVPIHINTNGVLLRKYAEFLRERAAAIRSITVSIDSPHPEVHDEIRGAQGTFRRAMAGIERVADVIAVDLACTLNQKNLHEIETYAQFARERGLPFRFQPLHDDGDNQLSPNQDGVAVEPQGLEGLTARLEAVLAEGDGFDKRVYYRLFEPFFRDRARLDRLHCVTAARLIYFVDPKGDVYPCDTRRDVALGNVYRTRFADVVRGAASERWRATCRKGENGCWCMYACVSPNNLRFQDLPLQPVGRGGAPLGRRWRRRLAELNPEAEARAVLPAPAAARDPAPGNWPFVSAVLASYNGGEFLERTLDRLWSLAYPAERFEIVLVDDAGTDDSIARARERFAAEIETGRLRIVTNERSLGVAGAYNRGVEHSDPRAAYVLKVDNDLLADPRALAAMVRLAEANPRAGIVGGRIYFHDAPERLQFLGGNLVSALRGPTRMVPPAGLERDPVRAAPCWLDAVNSCLALVRRVVFERAGLYPEFYGRYEYEDYDFAFAARRLGFGSLYCPEAIGHHAVSLTSTANDLAAQRVRLRARNGVLFMSRFAPAGWSALFLAYHLAKIPFDALRRGHSPWALAGGYLDGLRAARGACPVRYLAPRPPAASAAASADSSRLVTLGSTVSSERP